MPGHTEAVNVVKFFYNYEDKRRIILSGAADQTLRVWVEDESEQNGFRPSLVLSSHQASVNCIAHSAGSEYFVSGSADGTLKYWKLKTLSEQPSVTVTLQQTIELRPKHLPLAVDVAPLSDETNVLAVAGTRATIQIYVISDGIFTLVATLTGHEGWIRGLAFTQEPATGDLLLASASQDRYIRLWRLHQGETLPEISKAANDPALGVLGRSLSNKPHRFRAGTLKYSVTFEALLLGHEDWIFSVSWSHEAGRLRLLSASADNSLALWEADPASSIWICSVRLGEISAQKGSTTATGSTGGFWIGLWSPAGDCVMSLGRTGSWRLWQHDAISDMWKQRPAIGGHVKEVKGIAWSPDGSYLLSTSSDQTTRLHAEWKRNGLASWHEFSRPQIHGYDLNCIAALSNISFVSGADEKLLRVFSKPGAVASLLERLCKIQITSPAALPDAANIPVLGLSNKAIETAEDDTVIAHGDDPEGEAVDATASIFKTTSAIEHPPLEDQLSRHMLWPEVEKLYGHGYEISAVAASHDGSVIATACRASSIDHAVIRLYETKEWREIKPSLSAHSLTVTALAFSHDDQHLLSVGRDRQWAIFKRKGSDAGRYTMHASNAKGHSRMILDCSWTPLNGNFVTAGRDKLLKIWQLEDFASTCKVSLPTSQPVTAVSVLPQLISGELVIAYALEAGSIHVAAVAVEQWEAKLTWTMDRSIAPSKTVNCIRWRRQHPQDVSEAEANGFTAPHLEQLAVASDDSSVRVYEICLPTP